MLFVLLSSHLRYISEFCPLSHGRWLDIRVSFFEGEHQLSLANISRPSQPLFCNILQLLVIPENSQSGGDGQCLRKPKKEKYSATWCFVLGAFL